MAAEDTDNLKPSIDEIKTLLENKKKEKGEAVNSEIFTDPRFIEIFEKFFKPLIDAGKSIKDNLTEKKKISVFDVIGLSDRLQETKRNALNKEIDKLTEKVRNIAKNLGNVRYYTLSDVLGLTKSERAANQRIINNAIRSLSLSIHRSSKNLSDSAVVMKFIGLKPIKMPEKFELAKVEPPVAIEEPSSKTPKKPKVKVEPPEIGSPSTIDDNVSIPTNKASLAERETAARAVVPVAVVEVSEELKAWFEHAVSKGSGGGAPDKGLGTGSDRESYSHSANALARLLALGASLLGIGIPALLHGMFDQGPLKGVEKMVATYSLKFAASIGKAIVHYIGNIFPRIMKVLSSVFRGELGVNVAKSIVKLGPVAKMGARLLGFLSKILKKVPGIGALISIGFAINRFANGDIQGGLIDLASGAASTIPVVGTAVSIGLDLINAQADLASGGVTPYKKGWLGKFNEFISKWFSRLILFHLNTLPFGLGKKVAGWLGISTEGLMATAEWDGTSNPNVEHATERFRQAQKTRYQALTKQQDILKNRKLEDLTDAERAEYLKQSEIVSRADKTSEEQRNIVRGSKIPKPVNQNPVEVPNANQKAIAGEEHEELTANESSEQEEKTNAKMRVDRPVTNVQPITPKEDEAVSTLKKINENLDNINAKTSEDTPASSGSPFVSVSSISNNSNGGGNGQSPLQFAIESMRDTAHTTREKSRNMILDYRSYA